MCATTKLLAVLTLCLAAACNGTSDNGTDLGGGDMGTACGSNPMTNLELLNACTNAQSSDKMPFHPTLAPNGQLPPLQ